MHFMYVLELLVRNWQVAKYTQLSRDETAETLYGLLTLSMTFYTYQDIVYKLTWALASCQSFPWN